jgi:hypothetical protein
MRSAPLMAEPGLLPWRGSAMQHAASVVYSETNIYSYLCKGRDNVNVSTCNLHDAICATAAAGHAIA